MPSPEVPDWFTPADPWLPTKMRQVTEIADAERRLGEGLERALSQFLSVARHRILGGDALTAAAGPDLAAWPEREQTWLEFVVQFIWELLKALFGIRFRRETQQLDKPVDTASYVQHYLDGVWQRVKTVPEQVFAEVQAEIRASAAAGDSPAKTRERVADILRIDAPSRRVRNLIAQLERTIADPTTSEGVRREARARLAVLKRRTGRENSLWWPVVATNARTEGAAVLNAATEHAGEVLTQVTGERHFKQWWSMLDTKVRLAHRRAHGQTQPVGRIFRVAGFPMRFPGDPAAPIDLTANCRCSLLLLGTKEGEQQRRAYTERSRLTASGQSMTGRDAVTTPEGGAMESAYIEDVDQAPVLAAGTTLSDSHTTVGWRGLLAPFGVPSGDGRIIDGPQGAPNTRDLPLPLLWQRVTAEGHDGAVTVGSITRVWAENGNLMGEGRFDLGSDDGREIVRQIDNGFARWVSVGLDNPTSELGYWHDGRRLSMEEYLSLDEYTASAVKRVAVVTDWRLISLTLVAEPAFHEAAITLLDDDEEDDDMGSPPVKEPAVVASGDGITANPETVSPAATTTVYEVDANETIVPVDTFAAPSAAKRDRAEGSGAAMPGGRYPIENRDDLLKAIKAVGRAGGKEGTDSDRAEVRKHIIQRAKALGLSMLIPRNWASDGSLKASVRSTVTADATRMGWYEQVAAAVPLEPSESWFADPQLTGPTKMRVTAEGRVYGHIADWKQCHASLPGTPAPRAVDRSYSKFHRHPVRTAEGTRIKTGPLAAGGHADSQERELWPVQRHYDDPRYVLADVVVGEDEHGIWASGALRPGISAYQVMFADRYSFSGDWRNGELLAACAVSVPGFHLDDDDTVEALAASAAMPVELIAADLVPRARVEDDEVVALLAAGVVFPDPPRAAAASAKTAHLATITVDPNPDQWMEAGKAFARGQHQGELEIAAARKADKEQRANAAIAAEAARRVYGGRFAALQIPSSGGA